MKSYIDLSFREKTLEDEPFIYSSQIKNLFDSYPHSCCKWKIFNENQSKLIKNLFTISNTIIACLKEEPDIIIGYLMYTKFDKDLIIHYEYVKQAYRNNYVASDLLEVASKDYNNNLIIFSQMNDLYSKLKKKHLNFTYDPFIINILLDINRGIS